jgi:hypothetical protein
MKRGYIVVREQKNISPKFWVCEDILDAMRIAQYVTRYWTGKYKSLIKEGEYDTTLYEDLVFHFDLHGYFRVFVQPQTIRKKGEYQQEEE